MGAFNRLDFEFGRALLFQRAYQFQMFVWCGLCSGNVVDSVCVCSPDAYNSNGHNCGRSQCEEAMNTQELKLKLAENHLAAEDFHDWLVSSGFLVGKSVYCDDVEGCCRKMAAWFLSAVDFKTFGIKVEVVDGIVDVDGIEHPHTWLLLDGGKFVVDYTICQFVHFAFEGSVVAETDIFYQEIYIPGQTYNAKDWLNYEIDLQLQLHQAGSSHM